MNKVYMQFVELKWWNKPRTWWEITGPDRRSHDGDDQHDEQRQRHQLQERH